MTDTLAEIGVWAPNVSSSFMLFVFTTYAMLVALSLQPLKALALILPLAHPLDVGVLSVSRLKGVVESDPRRDFLRRGLFLRRE